jgi:hypothetical protein
VIKHEGNAVHLQVRSDLDAAMKAIAQYSVVDLRTQQPSLEDVFLAYYQDAERDDTRKEAPAA